jgi:hypothetical protein
MMPTNMGFYFETQKEVRGGKFIWFADSNPSLQKNQLLGGDLLNPKKGFDHFYAGQLGKYVPGGGLSSETAGITIFRAFKPKAAASNSTTIVVTATGYEDAPEVGMIVMKAPASPSGTGQSAKITAVVYDKENEKFTLTVDTALTVTTSDIIVEATGTAASASAKPLVDKVNMWIEKDTDLMPTEGFGVINGKHYLSGVSGCAAYIGRMQPLPAYILSQNKSLIDGVFEL